MNKNEKYIKEIFPVLEMTCAACAINVESMLKGVEGVKDAGVNFTNQEAWIEYNSEKVTPEVLQNSVRSIGYDLLVEKEYQQEAKENAELQYYRKLRKRTIWSSFLSLPIVTIGMFFMEMRYANWYMLILSTPVIFYFGRNFFINAWKQAKHGKANMDTLVALSTGIAWLFSTFNTIFPAFWHSRGLHPHVYFEAAAVVIAFISIGKMLEDRAKSNTSSAIKKLIGLQPKTATLIGEDDVVKEISINDVKEGNILLIRPGERIPVDGTVTTGLSFVNESMITGEPIPVTKKHGSRVFAGTINQKGSFRFISEKVGADTLLAQIIKMVREAQGSKAPVQKMVDKIAGIFVPIVIILSTLTFFTWIVIGGNNAFTYGLLTAVTVLVIACPCALGLATPTAIMVGIGKGAEHNILIKDAESLEVAYSVNAVVLDKTGTITEGKPKVTDFILLNERKSVELKSILLGIESQSEHPLAEAIVEYLNEESIKPVHIADIKSETGKGVWAFYNNKTYSIGNEKYLVERNILLTDGVIEKQTELKNQGKTVILFAQDIDIVAIIAIADKIKSSSKGAIVKMQRQGLEVYMLTGDSYQTASAIARETGIKHFKAEALPSDKADFIKKLQSEGRKVAMVGDGINDSQALAQSDVSIAMGKGSDIAMDVAKMTLITSDLNGITTALTISRQTIKTIRQNLFWAFIYNLIGIPLAMGLMYPINGFLLNPMIAGAAMALSSVSVVGNSLRLKISKLE